MDEQFKYVNEHYPNLHPCKDGCKYWRPLYAGTYAGNTSKCCHYNLDNGELRGDYPDCENGHCSKYTPGIGKGKRTTPYFKIRDKG